MGANGQGGWLRGGFAANCPHPQPLSRERERGGVPGQDSVSRPRGGEGSRSRSPLSAPRLGGRRFCSRAIAMKTIRIFLVGLALSACNSAPRSPVVLVGADGASWDLVFQYSRAGRLPHLSKLIQGGSSGYVNSILWRRFGHDRRGYFSPIVWTSIATGKLPDQHGIEDFVLPAPSDRDFFLLGGAEPGRLELPLLHPGSLLLDASAAGLDRVTIDVRLEGESLAKLSFDKQGSVETLKLPAETIPLGPAHLEFRVEPMGPAVPALRVRRLGLLDEAGRLRRWLHPHQNESELVGAWHYPEKFKSVPVSSEHMLARPVWDIAAAAGRRAAVIGWWATWPAPRIPGVSLITDWAGSERRTATVGLTEPPALMEQVQAAAESATALTEQWKRDLADALDCDCLGPVQPKIYLQHRREDELRVQLAERLAAERPELLMVYLRLIDTTSHQFMQFERPAEVARCKQGACNAEKLATLVPLSYEILDEAIGRLQRVMPEDTTWIVVSDHGQIAPEGRPGVHQNNGVVLVAGPGVRSGLMFEAQETDITPTLLYLLDVPIGTDMTGRLLTQALEPELLNRRPPRYVVSHEDLLVPRDARDSEVAPELLEERMEALKALGYVK